MGRKPHLPFPGHLNTRNLEQAAQKSRREAIREALVALKSLRQYLVSAKQVVRLQEFLDLSGRFIEAVDKLPPQTRDAFERHVSSSRVAPLYRKLCKACLTRSDKGDFVLDDE